MHSGLIPSESASASASASAESSSASVSASDRYDEQHDGYDGHAARPVSSRTRASSASLNKRRKDANKGVSEVVEVVAAVGGAHERGTHKG